MLQSMILKQMKYEKYIEEHYGQIKFGLYIRLVKFKNPDFTWS